ncbi:MAG TPA: signal peptidase I [Blastocatellia bacterium]|nr:signal peptidase I [Blastocatellia bacterium]
MIEHEAGEPLPGVLPEGDASAGEVSPAEIAVPSIHVWGEAKALIRDVLFAVLTAILLVVFVIQPVKVEGTSMLPRLHDGERIFVNKWSYQFNDWPSERLSCGHPIERGDIVVFWYPRDPGKSFIKRVIGLPGETVRVDTNGQVYIDGKLLDEPYLSPEYTSAPQRTIVKTVKEHKYFVMGDNRDHSNDSRAWGLVPEKYIYGQALFRYWPLTEIGVLEH